MNAETPVRVPIIAEAAQPEPHQRLPGGLISF